MRERNDEASRSKSASVTDASDAKPNSPRSDTGSISTPTTSGNATNVAARTTASSSSPSGVAGIGQGSEMNPAVDTGHDEISTAEEKNDSNTASGATVSAAAAEVLSLVSASSSDSREPMSTDAKEASARDQRICGPDALSSAAATETSGTAPRESGPAEVELSAATAGSDLAAMEGENYEVEEGEAEEDDETGNIAEPTREISQAVASKADIAMDVDDSSGAPTDATLTVPALADDLDAVVVPVVAEAIGSRDVTSLAEEPAEVVSPQKAEEEPAPIALIPATAATASESAVLSPDHDAEQSVALCSDATLNAEQTLTSSQPGQHPASPMVKQEEPSQEAEGDQDVDMEGGEMVTSPKPDEEMATQEITVAVVPAVEERAEKKQQAATTVTEELKAEPESSVDTEVDGSSTGVKSSTVKVVTPTEPTQLASEELTVDAFVSKNEPSESPSPVAFTKDSLDKDAASTASANDDAEDVTMAPAKAKREENSAHISGNDPNASETTTTQSGAASSTTGEAETQERVRRSSVGDRADDRPQHRAHDVGGARHGPTFTDDSTFSSRSSGSVLREGKPLSRRVSMSAMPYTGARDRKDADGRYGRLSENRTSSPQSSAGIRVGLERHSSFSSGRLERSSPLLSRSRSSGSPMKQRPGSDVKRVRRLDEAFTDGPSRKESRIGSATDVNGRSPQLQPDRNAVIIDAKVRGLVEDKVETSPVADAREELPALPEIPLPDPSALIGILSETMSETGSNSTPTKTSKRPRLGWGQGLVASSPPQPPKRPRIGWGEGLVKQTASVGAITESSPSKVSSPSVKTTDSGEANQVGTSGSDGVVEGAVTPSDAAPVDAPAEPVTVPPVESIDTTVTSDAGVVAIPGGESSAVQDEAVSGDVKMEEVTQQSPVKSLKEEAVRSPREPSKEEILAAIDILDSSISDLNSQIKQLQSNIQDAEASKTTVEASPGEEGSADAVSPAPAQATSPSAPGAPAVDAKNHPQEPSPLIEEHKVNSGDATSPSPVAPVKVGVDSAFVELVTGIFSENLKRAAAANARVPKRFENGVIATKLYHHPSDYAFYQSNIDRGIVLSDAIRIKVCKRNRARHEQVKMLAREYIDLKKEWKLRVKKMEKDRKRQDKQRIKLKIRQAQKDGAGVDAAGSSGAGSGNGAGGHFSSVHTTHQSPHVQQILAASGGGGAAGGSTGGANDGASTTSGVRSSSRLTNNSSGDLQSRSDLEKIEQAKAQALLDQEVRKKRLKNAITTVIPDMLLTEEERRARYFARVGNGQSCLANGIVKDWKKRERAQMIVNPWSDLEKCIFVDKFLQYPKNFARISFALSNKTSGDVIAFYYRTKKVVDYKALLREQQLRRRGAGSKNTWSCWNLSACAAICLGVKFPPDVAKLLLHPSNFRSHQASDNILNSTGARLLLQTDSASTANGDGKTSMAQRGGDSLSALDLATSSARLSAAPADNAKAPAPPVVLDEVMESTSPESTDAEKFNLYTQKLSAFVAGQQRPFLINFADYFSDNSFSTGYEVSTLSVAERLKQYNLPTTDAVASSNGTKATAAAALSTASSSAGKATTAGDEAKAKHGPGGANKHASGQHLTKKEIKQQRKLKKMQEVAAASGTSASSTATSASASSSMPTPTAYAGQTAVLAAGSAASVPGTTGTPATGAPSHGRSRKGASATPGAGGGAASRASPRPGDEKPPTQGSKKSSKSGGSASGARRNSAASAASNAAATGSALTPDSSSHPTSGAAMSRSAGLDAAVSINVKTTGESKPSLTVVTTSQNAAGTPSGGGGNASGGGSTPVPTKRVVQKWTEAEKADFLKFFSVRIEMVSSCSGCLVYLTSRSLVI